MINNRYVYILPMGEISIRFLEALRLKLEDQVDLPFRLMKSIAAPEYAFNSERGQYHSMEILRQVLALTPEDAIKIVGLCNVDLYVPILTFIFGQAQIDGLAAMVSMKRLNEEFYGKAFDETITFQRTVKEVIHELGHTFGLAHCESHRCVMSLSIKVEHVDQKEVEFCRGCQALIGPKIIRLRTSE